MLEKIALNQGTLKHLNLAEALSVAKSSGYTCFGVWMDSIFSYMKEENKALGTICQMILDTGLEIVELDFLREWLFVKGDAKIKAMKKARQMCIIAKKLNAGCICAPAFGTGGNLKLAVKNFQDFCDIANGYDIKIAIELVPWEYVNSISVAWKIIEIANKPNGGLLVDAFTFYKGPSKLSDFNAIPGDKIFLVHICDFPEVYESIDLIAQARTMRVLPGEGVLDLEGLLSKLFEIGYDGKFSLEILSSKNKDEDPLYLSEKGKTSVETLLNKFYGRVKS